jgi:nitrile hydratase accessory protein
MLTRFEHLAANSMLGAKDAPPRDNGELRFDRAWERRAFGLAIALAKQGHYEWEAFRQELIAAIARWESSHTLDDPSWDYYQRWLETLERTAGKAGLVAPAEIDQWVEAGACKAR